MDEEKLKGPVYFPNHVFPNYGDVKTNLGSGQPQVNPASFKFVTASYFDKTTTDIKNISPWGNIPCSSPKRTVSKHLINFG